MTEEYLSPNEAAELGGMSVKTLKRLEKQGILTNVRRTPGGHRRYTRGQIEQLMRQDYRSVAKQPLFQAGTTPSTSSPTRQPFTEFGVTGLRQWGGSIYEERLRELQGRPGRILKREMRINDPVLAAVFFGLVNTLRQTEFRIEPASDNSVDQDVAEFVESNFDDFSWSWMDQETFIIEPLLEQGFSLLEVIYKRRNGDRPTRRQGTRAARSLFDDGRIGWRKWAPRPAESLAPGREWDYDEAGGIQGITQQPDFGVMGGPFYIPIEKLLHFRTTVHPANNPEGQSIHRPAYLPWYYTTAMQEVEAIGVERDLNGIPIMYLGVDRSMDGTNSDYELSKDLVTGIRIDEQHGMVLPGPKMTETGDGTGFLFELASTNGTRQWDVGTIVDRYDKRKALVVLAQFILLGMEQVGSYALSQHQGDMFMLAASAWLKNIADIINRHAIPKLVNLNVFPGRTGYPMMVFDTLGLPDLGQVSEYVNKLADKQLLTYDRDLEQHLRQIAGLPPAPEVTEVTEEDSDTSKKDIRELGLTLHNIAITAQRLSDMGTISIEEADELVLPLLEETRASLAKGEPVEVVGKHKGEPYPFTPCPFCSSRDVEIYKDHGNLCVCQSCSKTFDPMFHYGRV